MRDSASKDASVGDEARRIPRWLTERAAELSRFGVAGLATDATYFVLLWLVGQFGDRALWVRATLAYAGSIVLNYALQRSFTFRSQRTHRYSGPRYLTVHFVGLLINSAILWVGVDMLHAPFVSSQIVAMALVAAWSYSGQRLWAF